MSEMVMPRVAVSRPEPRRKFSLPRFSSVLERVRSDASPEARRERMIRAAERDGALAERHHSANVVLMGAYLDPLYMPFAHK